jgi:lysophospholipase L1-like esterase
MWLNQDFGLAGENYKAVGGNERASGELPKGWLDRSGWCEAQVRYARADEDGTAFLRVEGQGKGKVQFIRILETKYIGTAAFRVTLRARTRSHAGVLLGIRQVGQPEESDVFYAATIVDIQKEWKDFDVTIRGELPRGQLAFYLNFGVPADLDLAWLKVEPIALSEYVPPTVTPEKREDAAEERYKSMDAEAKTKQPPVIFLGDSITDGWNGEGKTVWEKEIAPCHAMNFGMGANRVEHLLWQVEHSRLGADYQPRLAVILIGANNVFKIHSVIDIEDGMKALLGDLRTRAPKMKILVLGVLPSGRQAGLRRQEIQEINRRYARLCDGKQTVFFDFGVKLLAEEGVLPPEVSADATHLTAKGYEIWAENVMPKIQELLALP